MSRSNNFFAEFVKDDFFEKQASENENVKNALGGVTPSVLEKLAEEIGAICNQEEAMTLEEKLASEEEEAKEEEKEETTPEDKKEGACKSAENEEADKETKEDSSEDKEAEDETGCEDNKECNKDEKKEGECKSAEDEEPKEEAKEDSEKDVAEDEIVKKAYELAEQKLAERGLSVEDYVFQKTANEEVSEFIADYAEKLAFLSDRPTLQVADEIITSVTEKLG